MNIHRKVQFKTIAVLMTSFNRRDQTLACLVALSAQRDIEGVKVTVFLVDDNSTDGTSDAVQAQFPEVNLLHGDGSLFWNGGMRLAFGMAMQRGFDAYFFLNDDTVLYEDAVRRLIHCAVRGKNSGNPPIVVGSTHSPITGKQSYGGFTRRGKGLKTHLRLVSPHPSRSTPCDTMNGNFALIPAVIAECLGNLEKRFRHQFGDIDYGLRARLAGFDVVVAPGFVGECLENSDCGTWRDANSTLAIRWKNLCSPKGVPPREWLLFVWRHYGWRFPVYAISPYVKTIASALLARRCNREPVPECISEAVMGGPCKRV
jgi:GT2 family glycosyltransferase